MYDQYHNVLMERTNRSDVIRNHRLLQRCEPGSSNGRDIINVHKANSFYNRLHEGPKLTKRDALQKMHGKENSAPVDDAETNSFPNKRVVWSRKKGEMKEVKGRDATSSSDDENSGGKAPKYRSRKGPSKFKDGYKVTSKEKSRENLKDKASIKSLYFIVWVHRNMLFV